VQKADVGLNTDFNRARPTSGKTITNRLARCDGSCIDSSRGRNLRLLISGDGSKRSGKLTR
jgi:hypothetical protein